MERQQNHYHTVLETANRSAEDNKPVEPVPLWQIPSDTRDSISEAGVFGSRLGQFIGRHAERMNYFQFCRILETLLPADSVSDGLRQAVRFRRKTALSFPAGEIAAVEAGYDGSLPAVRTTFLGLYGVDSILPDYFLNDIATHKAGSDGLAGFLDIFNHRISELFYAAWKKYRYPVQFQYGGTDKLSLLLLHLIGQNVLSGKNRPVALQHQLLDSKILGLLGVFYQKTRTAEGIVSLIKYLSPGAKIDVAEFQTQWVSLGKPETLGQKSLKLNRGSAVLGTRVKDNSHLIHIDITPDSFEEAAQFLPKGESHGKLMQLLQIYLGHRTDAAVYLNLKKQWIPQSRLKSTQMLGINTGLGQSRQDRRIKVGFYTYTPNH